MIRLNKPAKILEWGIGTNTTNQIWMEMGQGKILSAKRHDGTTTMVIEVPGSIKKQNLNDDTIKVSQLGEGMTPLSERWGKITPRWGEVAVGKLRTIEQAGSKSKIYIDVTRATKVGQGIE